MSVLDLRNSTRLFYGSAEAQQLYHGSTLLWTKPAGISDYYGLSAGQIPMDFDFSKATLYPSTSNIQRVPNLGGSGAMHDLTDNATTSTATNAIPLVDGKAEFKPAAAMKWNVGNYPNLIGTRIFIVADLKGLSVDQYLLGNGSPQANVQIRASGNRLDINRRNPSTNSFETANVNQTPPIAGSKRLFEIEFSNAGVIRVWVDGQLRGSNTHPYPEYLVRWFAAGQNPANGGGMDASVWRVLSLIEGGTDYASNAAAIRDLLLKQYQLGKYSPSSKYFTNFDEFSVGPLVAPWQHIPIHTESFRFGSENGNIVLHQPQTLSGDSGAFLTSHGGNMSIEVYAEGKTSFDGSSSLEFIPAMDINSTIYALYRVTTDPAANTFRLRRRNSYGNHDTLDTVPFDFDPGDVVCFLSQFDGSTMRIKMWMKDNPEPANWSLVRTGESSNTLLRPPYYGGVYMNASSPTSTIYCFGVGLEGASAPRQ